MFLVSQTIINMGTLLIKTFQSGKGIDKIIIQTFFIIELLQEQFNQEAYFEGIKQVMCHLIGISNATTETSKNGDALCLKNTALCLNNKNLIFKSVVFVPITQPEKAIAENYIEYNKEFVSRINFLPKNINISDPIITYRQIWNAGVKDSIQYPELKTYLERYLLVHA